MKYDTKKIAIFGGAILIVLILFISMFGGKKVTCTRENEIIKGFNNKETVVFKLNRKGIKSIDLDRKVILSDYYRDYGTYTNTLETTFNSAYEYLNDSEKNISVEDDKALVKINTKNNGIILNNLTIDYNSEEDDTSLRFDYKIDLDNDSTAYKVKDKKNKATIKKELKDLGYTCK